MFFTVALLLCYIWCLGDAASILISLICLETKEKKKKKYRKVLLLQAFLFFGWDFQTYQKNSNFCAQLTGPWYLKLSCQDNSLLLNLSELDGRRTDLFLQKYESMAIKTKETWIWYQGQFLNKILKTSCGRRSQSHFQN